MRITGLALVLVWSLSVGALARSPAQMRLYCASVRLLPATGGPGQVETLSITTDSSLTEINNELSPFQDVPVYFILDDPASAENIPGQILIALPGPVDLNRNGFDDFYESSQAVPPTTTQGAFTTAVDSGTVSATWSRAAGATTGTCVVQMTGQVFGQLPAFTHTFELIEYTGPLNYTPTTNLISGPVQLTLTGDSSSTLSGLLSFTRVATNRFNWLDLQSGTLTNASAQVLSFGQSEIDRDQNLRTNYYGYVSFADGDPNTGTADYRDWVLSIDDPNDENGNGIPDFSDDPVASAGQAPMLGLGRSGDHLLLSLTGDVGRSYELQEMAALGSTNWSGTATITLTNSPQVISLPVPATATRFWRAKSL